MNTYKENLLINARYQMSKVGGKIRIIGKHNKRHVLFIGPEGNRASVWFPEQSRVSDLEVKDIKDAIEHFSGAKAFSM